MSQSAHQSKSIAESMRNIELMEVGEHCTFCGQIDFLPFRCECKNVFCSQHRNPETHQCSLLARNTIRTPTSQSKKCSNNEELSAASWFPDRPSFKLESKVAPPTNIKDDLKAKNNTSALFKLRKFFESKPTTKKTNASKKIIENSLLKSKSKGDTRVPALERIHLWVQVIDDESTIDKTIRSPLFVSRSWPIGRGLDFMARELKLKNLNNSTNDSTKRLFLFKDMGNNNFEKLSTGGRCSQLKSGDTVFIVRGSESM